MRFFVHRRRFADLSEQEIRALAISSEEDGARIYSGFAQQLRAEYPDSAAFFLIWPKKKMPIASN